MNQLNLFWETWVDVVEYEGLYQVNGRGDVKSLNYNGTGREKILRPSTLKNGYLQVMLYNNGKTEQLKVHRIIYESFYGNIPEGMVIDHIDTNRQNNSVENLRCVTHKENVNNPITKKRMNEANKKKAKGPEWRKKQLEGSKKRSQNTEWQKNVSEANKKRCSKPVIQYDLDGNFIKEWSSMHEIERELGFDHANISACCKGKRKSAYGFIWKYKEAA